MMKNIQNFSYQSLICNVTEVESQNPEEEFHRIVDGLQGYLLWGILFVILTICGTIGNIITIIVLRRDPIISVLNTLLIALAVSDSLAPQANALIAVCHYFLSPAYSNSVTFLKFYDFIKYIIHPLSTMFTMSSSWIMTATTLFRLIAVIMPLKARSIINKRLAYTTLTLIYGFGLISIIPIYMSVFRTYKCTNDMKMYQTIGIRSSMFMSKVYTPAVQVMCFYIPWLIALITWIFLLRSLKKHNQNTDYLMGGNYKSDRRYSKTVSVKYTNGRSKSSIPMEEVPEDSTAYGDERSAISVKSILKSPSVSHKSFVHALLVNQKQRCNNSTIYKITLTVVVLCFTNLVSRIFTFTFIFEVIFNHIQTLRQQQFLERVQSQPSQFDYYMELKSITQTAKTSFPNFLAYSLLFNNIFLCLNHGCNIFIYILTNPRFKKNIILLLRQIFCCKKNEIVKRFSVDFTNQMRRHETSLHKPDRTNTV